MADKDVVAYLKRREQKGIEFLIDEYGKLIYGVIKYTIKNNINESDFEDIFYEVVMKIWDSIFQYDEEKGVLRNFITNKRIFFVNTNVINQELKHKFVELKDVLGIVFTNRVIKVRKDKLGNPNMIIKTSKMKIALIIWSIVSVIGFFMAKNFN